MRCAYMLLWARGKYYALGVKPLACRPCMERILGIRHD